MWSNNIRRIDEALRTFRNNCNELRIIIHQQEKQIQFLETKALHLSMFYIASQLVIYLSNSSKPSSYQCRNWWKPFFISLSLSVVFGLNFAATVIKYMRTKYEQERNFIDQGENYHQMTCLESYGGGHDLGSKTRLEFVDLSEACVQQHQHEPDMFEVYQRCAHLGLTALALLAFTAVVLHTCRSSACAEVA